MPCLVIELLVLLEDLSAAGHGLVSHEPHVVSKAVVRRNPVVAGKDNASLIPSLRWDTAGGVRAAHEHCITDLVLVVLRDGDLVGPG